MTNLFIKQNFKMHSGGYSDFKLECDALTEKDYHTLAHLVSKQFSFQKVLGIPRGGIPFASILEQYEDKKSNNLLIVDDVLTTGASMILAKNKALQNFEEKNIKGIVIFARGELPNWVSPIFALNSLFWH
ncbi:Orotate phosphoribosyltransferase [Candidatus Hepatincola sp. Av]